MAKFDSSKVISYLCLDKAEVGNRYYFCDNLYALKLVVENDNVYCIGKLNNVVDGECPFQKGNDRFWCFIYPYEEPQKKRMTNRQLTEWMSKGNGECKYLSSESMGISNRYTYLGESNDECLLDIRIRPWDSDEWVEPTYDVYLKDCKGVTQDEIDDVAYRDGC